MNAKQIHLKLFELRDAELTKETLRDFRTAVSGLLSLRDDFSQTLARTASPIAELVGRWWGDGSEAPGPLQAALGECFYGLLGHLWAHKLPLPSEFRATVSEIVQECNYLSTERPYVFSFQELASGDFVRLMFEGTPDAVAQKSHFILNFAFLNSLKNLEFADASQKGSGDKEIGRVVYAAFMGEFQRNPEGALLMLPSLLSNLTNPLYFAAVIQKTFVDSPTAGLKILALESLMFLIGSTSFEWPDFYPELYRMIQKELGQTSFALVQTPGQPSLFRNRYTVKFFKLLDLALRPESLGKAVVASFIKILLMVATKSSADIAALCTFLIFNIAKKRESIKPLLTFPPTFDPATDPFDVSADLYSNRVLESQLWESELLKRHFDPRVSRTFRSLGGKEIAALRFEFADLNLGHFDKLPLD